MVEPFDHRTFRCPFCGSSRGPECQCRWEREREREREEQRQRDRENALQGEWDRKREQERELRYWDELRERDKKKPWEI